MANQPPQWFQSLHQSQYNNIVFSSIHQLLCKASEAMTEDYHADMNNSVIDKHPIANEHEKYYRALKPTIATMVWFLLTQLSYF